MLIGALCAATALGAGATRAQTPAQDIILIRQAGMALQQGVIDAMVAAVKSGADVKTFKGGADAIGFWAEQIPLMFPPGSEKGHDTRAKPEIWSDFAGFTKDAKALADAAGPLKQAAEAGDGAAFASQLKTVGDACVACHRSYRQRR